MYLPLIYQAFSEPRIGRYQNCQGFGFQKNPLLLYQANLRLSIQLFAVMSIFEVVLRNAIDRHYASRFGSNWLITKAATYGFLGKKGCDRSRQNLLSVIEKLDGKFSNDQVLGTVSK